MYGLSVKQNVKAGVDLTVVVTEISSLLNAQRIFPFPRDPTDWAHPVSVFAHHRLQLLGSMSELRVCFRNGPTYGLTKKWLVVFRLICLASGMRSAFID